MILEEDGVDVVARLMMISARTAPKGKGVDSLIIKTVNGKDLAVLADEMRRYGEIQEIGFFIRDSQNVADCEACVLIGARGDSVVGIDCGGCGYSTCKEMQKAQEKIKRRGAFIGPNCVVRMADLGIAVGSAVKTASIHNVDNRVMYSAGVAALNLGWLEGCQVAYGIPMSATGKNIFFDRKPKEE